MTMPPLRPYQQKVLSEVLACLQVGKDPLLVMPTGSGKTEVFTNAVQRVGESDWKTCIFVHRVELLRQASKRLTKLGIDHGVLAPGHDLTSHRVHVASIDTVGARIDSLSPWLRQLDLAIPDEAHHSVANKWDRVLQLPKRRLGVTATPCRTDGRGLGETGLFSSMIRGPSIRELTAAGYLAEARVYAPQTNIDITKVAKRGGDFAIGQLAAILNTDAVTAQALRWYDKISADAIMRDLPPPPAVAFCTTVEHAEDLAAAFRRHGVRAVSVDGTMSSRERDRAIGGLETGETQMLTSCDLVGEGLDIPAVSAAFLVRPTQSLSLFLQQVGRSLRPHPDKSYAAIIDLATNTARHGMFDANRIWDLQGGVSGIDRAVAGTWRCRKCSRVHSRDNPLAAAKCSCGTTYAGGVAAPPARLSALPPLNGIPANDVKAMKLQDSLKFCHSLRDFELLGKIMDFKKGWAVHAWERSKTYRPQNQARGIAR